MNKGVNNKLSVLGHRDRARLQQGELNLKLPKRPLLSSELSLGTGKADSMPNKA